MLESAFAVSRSHALAVEQQHDVARALGEVRGDDERELRRRAAVHDAAGQGVGAELLRAAPVFAAGDVEHGRVPRGGATSGALPVRA